MSNKNRILIIGDAMIDSYIYGSVGRVSPEAPVPVVCPTRENHCLGGAANVARNAAALGSDVTAMFIVGKDEKSEILKQQLDDYGVKCDFLIQDESQHTINKMRVIGNNQQIVRIDFHDSYSVSEELYKYFIEEFTKAAAVNDIVIISDYGKGTCTDKLCREVIKICKKNDKPVIIDPKGTDWGKYCGATIITPNMKEINEFSGIKVKNDSAEIEKKYGTITEDIGTKYLLLTRSECGMSLIGKDEMVHIPVQAHEVYDVSGAGDTVVAALATMLKPSLENIEDAVKIANIAAGIVVAKPGTAVVTREEIQDEISDRNDERSVQKIYTIDEYDKLMKLVNFWKTAGKRIVTTNGCYDIVHRGHVKLLEEAGKLGDRLIVAVNSDASVKRLKGEERPINSELDRAYVISALESVDAVVIFDPEKTPDTLSDEEKESLSEKALKAAGEAPMAIMRKIKPDIHVKGGDYNYEDVPEASFAGKLALIKLEEGYSTTNVIKKMTSK